jgi:hypothetical protein
MADDLAEAEKKTGALTPDARERMRLCHHQSNRIEGRH